MRYHHAEAHHIQKLPIRTRIYVKPLPHSYPKPQTFSPVVLFDTDEEALTLANDTEYGLISYVYSEDLKRAIRFAEGIEAGMVGINRGLLSDPAAPFGGVKQSGLGREGGFDGVHEFLQTKYIGVEI